MLMPVYLSRPDSLLDEHHLVVLQQSEEDGIKACWFFNNLNPTKRWRKSLLDLQQSVKDVFMSKSKKID